MTEAETRAEKIEARLREAGTPQRAEGAKRYLKSSLEHLGASVPQVRAEATPIAKSISSHRELLGLAKALWAEPVHERRLCAAFLLEARVELLGPRDLPAIQRFVRESKTWALVDVLADKVLGGLLLSHPEAADRLDRWAGDEDFWVRRAALLSQIKPLRAGAGFERFGRYADAMLDEREFFIRKAIGWVLREAAKSRPAEVYEWLLPRAGRASGVTMREAVKHLSPDQRKALLAARVGPAASTR
ncbi:MAG TPA: DNA alkylation repair protein [Solirubrobacterales bacterium]|nr:DNA alkylation repair protein [Solirubrobacterales bacterium]